MNLIVIDTDKCTNCRLCVITCPNKNFAFEQDRAVVIEPDEECNMHMCNQCIMTCPAMAISRGF